MKINDRLIIIAFALFSLFSVALTTLLPRTNEVVLVVGNPFKASFSTINTVAKADGAIVEGTTLQFAILAFSSNPTFISQLYKEGAWLVVSPRILSGCFGLTNRT